jgi:hypothetical protein
MDMGSSGRQTNTFYPTCFSKAFDCQVNSWSQVESLTGSWTKTKEHGGTTWVQEMGIRTS